MQGDSGPLQALQEGDQGCGILALVGVEDLPCLQVQHHRHVAVSFVGGELVHGEEPDLPKLSSAVAFLQVGLEHILHQVPAHPQILGRVLHGCDATQVHDEPAQSPEEPSLAVGERDRLSAAGAALGADLYVSVEDHFLPLAAHREAQEGPLETAVEGDVRTQCPAATTFPLTWGPLDVVSQLPATIFR